MDSSLQGEAREERAARNQSLFRAVNEKLTLISGPTAEPAATHVIACECADLDCVETLEVASEEYAEVRRDARHFLVRPGHVYPEVESVIAERNGYVVVEKEGRAAEVALEAVPPSE